MKWRCLRALGLFLTVGMITNALFVAKANNVVDSPASIEEPSNEESDEYVSLEDIEVNLGESTEQPEQSEGITDDETVSSSSDNEPGEEGEIPTEAPEESAEASETESTESSEAEGVDGEAEEAGKSEASSEEGGKKESEAPATTAKPEAPEATAKPEAPAATAKPSKTESGDSDSLETVPSSDDKVGGADAGITAKDPQVSGTVAPGGQKLVAGSFEEAEAGKLTGWVMKEKQLYWFENGVQAGMEGEGEEIFDPETEAWYWLDGSAAGAMAVDKAVVVDADSDQQVYYGEDGRRARGEVSRGDASYYYEPTTGVMVKGPVTLEDGRKVFYGLETGEMAKGDCDINGVVYHFNETDGNLESEAEPEFWLSIGDASYWYVDWVRQGWKPEEPDYIGEEIYDAATDDWYWLDGENQGRMAVDKMIYVESQADEEGNVGKWVFFGTNGRRLKGWSEDGTHYFDPTFGTMAKGTVVIGNTEYIFDEETGAKLSEKLIAGFEAYNIVCGAEAGVEYEYLTASESDSAMPVAGKAVFDYQTFESDETHAAKEGFEWKQVTVSMAFDDIRARYFGSRYAILFGLDYYEFRNGSIEESSSEERQNQANTVKVDGEEIEIFTNYETLRCEWGEDGVAYMTVRYECQVPVGYDGMAIALYDASNIENGVTPLDRLDENSLIFRMK